MSEFKIHKHMVDYLLQRTWHKGKLISEGQSAFQGLMVIHCPNQEKDATAAFFEMQMGKMPGAYDLFLYWPHRNCLAYDVKYKTGLSEAQRRFRSYWDLIGFPSAYGSSTEHLRDTLIAHGAKCRVHHVPPLDLRTDEEKKKDAFDFYKRPTH